MHKKLLAVIRPEWLADEPPDGDDWYANLLWFSGRKCLLLTHAGTLFTIFEPDVRAGSLRDPGRMVTELIRRELAFEDLPTGTFGGLDPGQVVLATTADRSVLGCMNDMAYMCEVSIDRSGGLAGTDFAGLNRALHRNITSARGYVPPIQLASQRLDAYR